MSVVVRGYKHRDLPVQSPKLTWKPKQGLLRLVSVEMGSGKQSSKTEHSSQKCTEEEIRKCGRPNAMCPTEPMCARASSCICTCKTIIRSFGFLICLSLDWTYSVDEQYDNVGILHGHRGQKHTY